MTECCEKLDISSTTLYKIVHSELTEIESKEFLAELRENKKEKIKKRIVEECQKGKTMLEIGEIFGIKKSSLYGFLQYNLRQDYKEIIRQINNNKEKRKLEQVKKYLEKGYCAAKIATEMKYSVSYIYVLIKKIN